MSLASAYCKGINCVTKDSVVGEKECCPSVAVGTPPVSLWNQQHQSLTYDAPDRKMRSNGAAGGNGRAAMCRSGAWVLGRLPAMAGV